jgi:hypothetical protein
VILVAGLLVAGYWFVIIKTMGYRLVWDVLVLDSWLSALKPAIHHSLAKQNSPLT